MQIHPKILERAAIILAKSEDEILIELTTITNKVVLMALLQEESSQSKRESILKILSNRLGPKDGVVSEKTTESLSQNYLNSVTESEQKTVIFTTIPDEKDKEETLEEDSVDSTTNNS
jgi:hypothetical protein